MEKMISRKICSSWWIIQFSENLWKMWENIEIWGSQQPKHEGIIWCQNQATIQQNSFSKDLLATEMKKTFMRKRLYLVLSILWISKIIMNVFWYDYLIQRKSKIMLMDIDSFIVYMKIEDIYKAKDVERRFVASNYELERPSQIGKSNY